jgi:hypothetical protein
MGRPPMTAEEQAYFDEQIHVLHQDMDTGQFEWIWNSVRTLTMEQALGSGVCSRRKHRVSEDREDIPITADRTTRGVAKFEMIHGHVTPVSQRLTLSN